MSGDDLCSCRSAKRRAPLRHARAHRDALTARILRLELELHPFSWTPIGAAVMRWFAVDTLLLGMGERYDVLVTVPRSGVFPLVAAVEGKRGQALAVLRAGNGPTPSARVRPKELAGKLLTYADLHATAADALPAGKPDQTYIVALTGNMHAYRWGAHATSKDGVSLPVRAGQRIRSCSRTGR